MQTEVDDGTNLGDLTYYPTVRRSERQAREPQRYESEVMCVTNGFEEPGDISIIYSVDVSGLNSAGWMEAMQFEKDFLAGMGIWEFVRLPEGRRVVKTRWVYAVRRDGKGSVLRSRARHVAKQFSQIQ